MSSEAIRRHEYLAFLADPKYLPQAEQESVHAEDVIRLVDGQRYEQNELTPTTIGRTARSS